MRKIVVINNNEEVTYYIHRTEMKQSLEVTEDEREAIKDIFLDYCERRNIGSITTSVILKDIEKCLHKFKNGQKIGKNKHALENMLILNHSNLDMSNVGPIVKLYGSFTRSMSYGGKFREYELC